jgi:DNA-binding beta-propeller fold protein YncE
LKRRLLSLNGPSGLVLDNNGHLYVANANNGLVAELDLSGNPIKTAFADLHPDVPEGLAFGSAGDLFVVGRGAVIYEFDSNGNKINQFSGSLNVPYGIAVSAVPEPVSTPTVYGAIAVGFVLVCRLMRRALA